MGLHVEVVGAGFGLRAQRLAAVEAQGTGQVVLGGVGRLHLRMQQQDARQQELIGETAVHRPAELAQALVIGRGHRVVHMAAHGQAIGQAFHRRARLRDVGRAAQRLLVHVRQVREVEQVVADQPVVGLVVHVARLVAPLRVLQRGRGGNARGVSALGVAHPHPQPAALLHHRVAAGAQLGRHLRLAGNLHALARRLEAQAVVHAADRVPLAPPHRQRRMTVRAAVAQGHWRAVLAAIEQQRLVEQGARQQRVAQQFVVPGGHVPTVPDPHRKRLRSFFCGSL